MLFNYLVASLRSMKRDRFFILVNLLSVAIAFALGTVTYFNYRFNATFNATFPDAEHIYKINGRQVIDQGGMGVGISPLPLGPHAQADLPKDIKITRYIGHQRTLQLEDNLFREHVGFVDEPFLDIFRYPMMEGGGEDPLAGRSVVLSQELAGRLFGNDRAVGKSLLLIGDDGQKQNFVVSGVLKDWPANSSFRFSMLLSIKHYIDNPSIGENDWGEWVDGTFMHIPDGAMATALASLNKVLPQQNTQNPHREFASYELMNLLEWPALESALSQGRFLPTIHPAAMIGMYSSAICLLLLAAFNFANTTIAISAKRLKEIAIRKVLGGTRRDIVLQVFFESLLQLFAGMVLSMILSVYLIPEFNALFEMQIVQMQFIDWPRAIMFLILLWLAMALLAAAYPALYISRLQSLQIFRDSVKLGGKNYFTKVMLVFEFIVVFYNLFALGAYASNAHYQEQLDKGYQLDGLINIPLYEAANYDILRHGIDELPGVLASGATKSLIGFGADEVNFRRGSEQLSADALFVTASYLETAGVRLKEGRLFLRKEAEDEVVINESLNRLLGGSMLNQSITVEDSSYQIVGIVDDFRNRPVMMNGKIEPTLLFQSSKSERRYLTIRTRPDDMISQAEQIEEIWATLFPSLLYRGFYQDEAIQSVRHTNKVILTINSLVAVVSVFICILGVYSLISLNIQRRRKEFGVRKVLGATASQVFVLINRDLGLLIIFAGLIGLPYAGYFTLMIMDIIFAYHIELTAPYYLLPLLLVLLIAAGSVGWKTWNNAKSNPVEQLRSD